MITSLKPVLVSFFEYVKENGIDIYNEFSFQHELGIFLRNHRELQGLTVQFERNVSHFGIKNTIKKEIDIVVGSKNEPKKFAIELKFPRNKQYPEQMYSFVKDIRFIEELRKNGFQKTYSLVMVEDRLFYEGGDKKDGIYEYFRDGCKVAGSIKKPTGKDKDKKDIELAGKYTIVWKKLVGKRRYYCIEI